MGSSSSVSMVDAFDKSVRAAIRNGKIKRIDQAALIEAGRKVAAYMDLPDWPYVDGKMDTINASTFLKYCCALGIAPDLEAVVEKNGGKLAQLREADKRSRA